MADGHLNKCKTCNKIDADVNYKKRLESEPLFRESEKKRAREKYFRLGYKDVYKQSPDKQTQNCRNDRAKFPEKYKARTACNRMKLENGLHCHHWSYQVAHHKDIIPMSILDHAKLHRYIVYDPERFMYRVAETGLLLDTRDDHEKYIEIVKETND